MLSLRTVRRVAALALMAGLGLPALAQATDQVVGLMKGVNQLSLYAKAYDPKAQASMAAKDLVFPMPVLDTDGDFLKVRLAGKEQWIDGAEVQVSKPVAYDCVKGERKPTRVASIQGASTGCK